MIFQYGEQKLVKNKFKTKQIQNIT